jgi:hypothetical protein
MPKPKANVTRAMKTADAALPSKSADVKQIATRALYSTYCQVSLWRGFKLLTLALMSFLLVTCGNIYKEKVMTEHYWLLGNDSTLLVARKSMVFCRSDPSLYKEPARRRSVSSRSAVTAFQSVPRT